MVRKSMSSLARRLTQFATVSLPRRATLGRILPINYSPPRFHQRLSLPPDVT